MGFTFQTNFHTKPENVEEENYRRYYILALVSLFGLCVHLSLLFIFYLLNITPLTVLNILSVFIWTSAFITNKKGKHDLAIHLITFEVVFHSVAAVYYLGLETGFQFYLLSIAALVIIFARFKPLLSIGYNLMIISIFASLYYLPEHTLYNQGVEKWFPYVHFINIFIANLPLSITLLMTLKLTLKQETRLRHLADKDELTNLYNRRFARNALNYLIAANHRNKTPLIIALADVDYFKMVNDQFGHEEGDRVLIAIADLLANNFRQADLICRWGGEEFLIILPATSLHEAQKKLDDIRKKITTNIKTLPVQPYTISMSFGVSEYHASLGLDKTIKLADDALYQSKKNGRNRVTVANHLSYEKVNPYSKSADSEDKLSLSGKRVEQ
ncbi:GGDEF domain-containing protein [Catenovulum sp. 2E275]|uniref:GGDEF domain-containing protein n=1 Tax=Catenovulum sp. 2E275 TaxID=2980497 RepID=UPI0021CF571E|nr:GGDEF domain-containing protein [Catenovulum sp. 2E275]MCU4677595.1 GGDEF domain-containing protein [Catenovulum sp. 2E275]